MIQTVECSVAREVRAVSTEFDSAQFEQDRADAHLLVIDDNKGPKAQCSLWWSQVPQLPHWHLGTIGHYCAEDDSAAHILLARARTRLRAVGCNRAIGPMDGSSWRRYRFVTEAGTEPAFFLEPQNPPDWPKQFTDAGFSALAHYISSLNSDLSQQHNPRLAKAEARLRSLGVVLRSLRPGEVEPYLPRIHQVCRVAFRTNYLYTDFPQSDFLRQYEQLIPVLSPELILVAEQHSETVGFLFAVPDLRRKQGLALDTFIIKTVAILPRYELGGLGTLLVGRAQQIGADMGFRRSIHALMHAGNASARNISDAYATPMRGYTLYAQELCT